MEILSRSVTISMKKPTILMWMIYLISIGLLEAITKGLLSDDFVISSRVLTINVTNGALGTSVWWSKNIGSFGGPHRVEEDGIQVGLKPDPQYPW